MKKVILITLFAFVGIMAFSQRHMNFMGIPLDGTISSFQQKLVAKGVKPDVEMNKSTSIGTRCFTGVFSGEKAEIYVYYNPKTKIVYRAKACITRENSDDIKSLYKNFILDISDKYKDVLYKDKGTYKENENTNVFIYDRNYSVDENAILIGAIQLYISDYYQISYSLHLDYFDIQNKVKNDNINSDDL